MNSDGGNEDSERVQIRAELASMSFEDLQKLKEKLGSKDYNEAVFGVAPKRRVSKNTVLKRENKNRPREASSKKYVPLVEKSSKDIKEVRDPRFDSLCGTFNAKAFKRSYSFLSGIKQNELKKLTKELSNEEDPERQQQIKYLIQRTENQIREEKRNKEKEVKKDEEYHEKVKMMKEGKSPGYVKKSEKKIYNLVEQYEDLKKSGKLEKHITKHRKKNAQKVRKNMSVM